MTGPTAESFVCSPYECDCCYIGEEVKHQAELGGRSADGTTRGPYWKKEGWTLFMESILESVARDCKDCPNKDQAQEAIAKANPQFFSSSSGK